MDFSPIICVSSFSGMCICVQMKSFEYTFVLACFGHIIQSVVITSVAMSGTIFYANLSLVFKCNVIHASLATENNTRMRSALIYWWLTKRNEYSDKLCSAVCALDCNVTNVEILIFAS